jgi:hypothetical protein
LFVRKNEKSVTAASNRRTNKREVDPDPEI